jgi:hypothetical protein
MCKVERVYAAVKLSGAREGVREYWEQHRDSFDGPEWLLEELLDREGGAARLDLEVELSAEIGRDERVRGKGSFGIAGPRSDLGAVWHRYHGPPLTGTPEKREELLSRSYRVGLPDIEDGINQMLGRDPELHRPPVLAWEPLVQALAAAGVQASEQELIDTPLTVELDREVTAVLEAP